MKKIGRNDPCPCGSGKKYKQCCLRKDESKALIAQAAQEALRFSGLEAPQLTGYMENHDCASLLDYLIALQLNPKNHGKNLRIEHIVQLAVSNLGKSTVRPFFGAFKALIDEEYPVDVMEDIPMNMYTETVVFFGGNYLLFPGLSTHVTELFRAMIEAVFHHNNDFMDDFRREVRQGISILLELGNLLAYRAGIKEMTRGNENQREKICPPLTNHSYVISEEMMTEMIKHYGWDKTVLDSFLLDKDDPLLLTDNAEVNPILYRPILHFNEGYYYIGISNQGCAINNFILKTAAKHHCLDELVQQTQLGIWMKIGLSCCDYMHWYPGVAPDLINTDAHYYEDLFRIDANWLAYVCYAKDTAQDVSIDGRLGVAHWNMDAHLKSTLSSLKKDERTKDFHILTFVLYSSMGEAFSLATNNQPDSDYLLLLDAFDFLQLVQTEKWDNMSLVRFARTRERMPVLSNPYNQALDVYSLYKHYGESFYFSDKATPDVIHIEPNDGCSLIFESKEKLNFHGIPISLSGRIAYIPVQRCMDYACLYKPYGAGINGKCCESYSVPVWVICNQKEKEGVNPTSISDTVITAVAYWMDVLMPSVDSLIKSLFKKPIIIELAFSVDLLADKELHDVLSKPTGKGALAVKKTETGVSVFMDRDFHLSFMGADNEAERVMMCSIISELIGLEKETATAIVDKHIPFGRSKMILMMEASNNPMAYPLWLYPPIYIHPATNQLMQDLFPRWMEEKGHGIATILQTKQQKKDFLHAGVDVLLEKLDKRLRGFDTKFMLKRLLNLHDALIFQREQNKILQPAQILCFGESKVKREEFIEDETRLAETGIATRALIEYLAATQRSLGAVKPGSDDIEGLLAIMSEIVKIGGVCDAIYLDVANHTIERLESGRYAIYNDDFNGNVSGFAAAHTTENVNQYIDDFDEKMIHLAVLEPKKPKEKDDEHIKVDAAFEADWGVSYTKILEFLYGCHIIAIKRQTTVLEISDGVLKDEIRKVYPDITDENATKCLDRLSLDKRADYLTPPAGLSGKDIFPWGYNRELSFLRRPIVRYKLEDGSISCLFGFRSCLMAGLQLTDLLYSGRLKNVGKSMGVLLGKFEAKKGRAFNEEVRAFLQKIPELTVWPHDVPIKPKSILDADKDYGDIDVMAYMPSTNVLYSIECKNTNTAKNVSEMKTEMDSYLGRGENPEIDKKRALVLKHLRRHQWLVNNIEQVKSVVGATEAPSVKSMMLTAAVIPTSYLKRGNTPLSILNFPELKLKGLAYLDSSKEPDMSVLA